jgi:hypothetical protein
MTHAPRLLITAALLCAACAPASSAAPEDGAPGESTASYQGPLRFEATTAVLRSFPAQLSTTVTATNTSAQAQTVEMPGGCTVLLRAYRTPERTGAPAWDQGRDAVCTLQLLVQEYAPGESKQYHGRATAVEILGDSLPNGRYYLTALLRPAGGAVEVPAGEADLAQ